MAAKNLHDHWKALASAFGLNSSSSEEEPAKNSTSGDTPGAAEVEPVESTPAESKTTESTEPETDESLGDREVVVEAPQTQEPDLPVEAETVVASDSPHHQTLVDFVAEDDEEEDEFEDAAVDVWGRLAGELGIEVTRPERLPHSSKKKAAEAHGRKEDQKKPARDVTRPRDAKAAPESSKSTGYAKSPPERTAPSESKPRGGFGSSLFQDEIDEAVEAVTPPQDQGQVAREPFSKSASGERQRELFAESSRESKSRKHPQGREEPAETTSEEPPRLRGPRSSPEAILSELFSVETPPIGDEAKEARGADATAEFAIEESEIEYIEIERLFEDDDDEDAPRRTRKRHFKEIEAGPSDRRGDREDFDDESEPVTPKSRSAAIKESPAAAERDEVAVVRPGDGTTEEVPERKRRRRRRRGKRGLEEGAEEGTRTSKPASEETRSTADTEEQSEEVTREREPSGRSRRRDRKRPERTTRGPEEQAVSTKSTNDEDFDLDDDVDERSERSGGRRKQRKFPTWEEAIGSIVDNNLSTRRTKQPPRGAPRRGNRGRGRPKS